MADQDRQYTRVARLADVQAAGCLTVQAGGHALALWSYGSQVYAVDNRCPHMGFPLSQGTVKDGVLICHWHHARFDLASGGTFDQFADDVRIFPVALRDGEVWVDLTPRPLQQQRSHHRERLRDGLERDIPLVMAKSILTLMDGSPEQAAEPFRIGLEFGTHYREAGWGQGLTILTCMMNLLPRVAPEDRPRALYHGLSAVARETAGMAPRFLVRALPGQSPDLPTLKRWFRQFVEVRDAEGAERALISAVRASAAGDELVVPEAARGLIADILFSAATDHRYLQIGHVLDFTNKALEALDWAGWEAGRAELVLSSLAGGYANADRMEESNAWRSPLDLIAILDEAFTALPAALESGQQHRTNWSGSVRERLTPVLLGEEPEATVAALLAVLREGCQPAEVAEAVAYAAALRIARFHTSNEFTDWDTALHTFTFANAVHQGLLRSASAELVRGVFDAAMSVYLDRFLNVPAAALPHPDSRAPDVRMGLAELPALLDRQQQVEAAAELVAQYLFAGGEPAALIAMLGKLLLREDRDFHTIQTVEASFRQFALLRPGAAAPAPPEAVTPAREALLLFAGGPGEGSVVAMGGLDWTRPLRATMDLLLVDQRGTGDSHPLNCEPVDPTRPADRFGHVFNPAWVRRCRATLEPQADLTRYTTDLAAQDIDDVRAALGYEKVWLYGGSYGTRLAQAYMRRYGHRVRAAVLDGVVPFDSTVPLTYAASAQQALDRVVARCVERAACRSGHPTLEEEFRALTRRFDAGPIPATVTLEGGAPVRVMMSRGDFAYSVRGILYNADAANTLPDLISHAVSSGDVSEFAQRYWDRVLSFSHDFAYGLHWSVWCAEDIPFVTERDIVAATAHTFMGRYLIDEYRSACAEWPRAPIAWDARTPVTARVPTLLVSGALDPVTPPQFAERVGRSLPLAHLVLSPATAHGSAWGCARPAVLQLLTTGSLDGLPEVCR